MMGRAVGDITGLYQTRELLSWLPEDAERLGRFAGHLVPEPGTLVFDIHPDSQANGVAIALVVA